MSGVRPVLCSYHPIYQLFTNVDEVLEKCWEKALDDAGV